MAKGDHDSTMDAINAQRSSNQQQYNQLQSQLAGNTGRIQGIYDQYAPMDANLRNNIENNYNNTLSKAPTMGAQPYSVYQGLSSGLSPQFRQQFENSMGDVNQAIGSYKNFMNTGGYSPEDLSAIRNRSMSPVTANYNQARQDLQRQQVLSGGNLANVAGSMNKMAWNQGKQLGDASTATEANIAQMVNQGKQFGTSGLATTALSQAQARAAVEQLDAQMKQSGAAGMSDIEKARMQAELQSESGLTSLYGTAPGATTALGSQLNNSLALQNSLYGTNQQGNLGLIEAQIRDASIPGDFQSILGNIAGGANLAGGIGKTLASIFGGGPGGGMFGGGNKSGGAVPGYDYGSNTNQPEDPYGYGGYPNQGYPPGYDYGSQTNQPEFPGNGDYDYGSNTNEPQDPNQGNYDYGYNDPYYDVYGNDIYNSGSYNDPFGGF